jgi:hypothetical protein
MYIGRNDRTIITIKTHYKHHTCIEDVPSILYPDFRPCYIYNGHISIPNKCKWVKNTTKNLYTLMWKKDCQFKPAGGDGTAMVRWLGQVTPDGFRLTPDAGWMYTGVSAAHTIHLKSS